MGADLVIIGFDGSPASERAIVETGPLLAPAPALVVTVWEPGTGFTALSEPAIPPAPLDLRVAMEVDRAMYERAQVMAQRGANLAESVGYKAEGLAVADELTVDRTLVRLAEERDAAVLVVGTHGHNALHEVLLGSTARGVIRHAGCPVVVRRGPER